MLEDARRREQTVQARVTMETQDLTQAERELRDLRASLFIAVAYSEGGSGSISLPCPQVGGAPPAYSREPCGPSLNAPPAFSLCT
jgi:hypothetical protein